VVINEYKQAYRRAGLKVRLENPKAVRPELYKTALRIRRDRPESALHKKAAYLWVVLTSMFVGVFCLGWVYMQNQWESPFAVTAPPKIISVRLSNAIDPINPKANSVQKVSHKTASNKNAAQEKSQAHTPSAMRKESNASGVMKIKPRSDMSVPETQHSKADTPKNTAATASATTNKVLSEQQQYENKLRLWLAQTQSNSNQTSLDKRQNKWQGKVKVKIKIARNGAILDATVLSISGSKELAQVALKDARNASPYPAIPKQFSGNSFTLQVTIRYMPK